MDRAEIERRAAAAAAWLRRSTGQPPRLTLWGWAADALLALALGFGAASGIGQMADEQRAHVDGGYLRPGTSRVPPLPSGPDGLPVPDVPETAWWHPMLAVLTALPLLTRRRFPLASLWVSALAALQLYQVVPRADVTWSVVALLVAAYSAVTYSRYRNLALVSVVVAAVWILASYSGSQSALPPGLLLFLLLACVGLAANAIHTLRERARALQREQEDVARLAVERERTRLARELHDVVGHNVSVMIVQAGAARKVMDTSPALAREALLAVEAGGRAAMSELRQVIGLLTDDDAPTDLAPQPGVAQLSQLVARLRATGVPITLDVTGPVEPLPAGVDLAAYRVVQEALTNAVKHAPGAAVTVTVRGTVEELRIEVTDTGGIAPGSAPGGGRGLVGLRERLAVCGGTLTIARLPTGGFRLLAVIPLRADR